MGNTTSWIVGGLLALLGIVGLFLSSRAEDQIFYYTGLAFFGFAVLLIFRLIAEHTGPDQTS